LVFLLAFDEVIRGAEFSGLPQGHFILPALFLCM
jgi:hypothetical protein